MSNVPQQYQHQQPPTNVTNSAYYGTTTTYQQPQHAGGNSYSNYGSSSQQHMMHWNGHSGGYTNSQAGNYFTATPHQAVAAHQSSHWYKSQNCQPNSVCYGRNPPPGVATSNSNGVKRMYSSEAPLHDITNNAHSGTNQPKRRKFATANTVQVLHKGIQRNARIVSNPASPTATPCSLDPSTGKVRIESIFHHVELLAQSYWQTGCPTVTALKPTTVDAFEGGISTR